MGSAELRDRTKVFAHRCVKLAVALPKTHLGKHIAGQLIRCGTSFILHSSLFILHLQGGENG